MDSKDVSATRPDAAREVVLERRNADMPGQTVYPGGRQDGAFPPLPSYVVALDETGSAHFISPHLEKLLGFGPQEFRRKPRIFFERVHDDDVPVLREGIRKGYAQGRYLVFEHRMVSRQGADLWFRSEASLVQDSEDAPPLLEVVMQDITDKKCLEEDRRRHAELQSSVKTMGRLVHELNSHLAVVIGQCDLILFRADLDSATRKRIEEILSSGQRAVGLVHRLLAISKGSGREPR